MAVTSMGGLMTVPGLSVYCASKYALEGLLESIGKGSCRVRDPRHRNRTRVVPDGLGGPVDGPRRTRYR